MPQVDWPAWHCPQHLEVLEIQADRVECSKSHHFDIVRGVPRFVSGSTYADHFGAQWNKFRRTQLDSYTGLPITRERLRRCFGEDLWRNLAGKQILECGCGAGRFTEILIERGAKVTSIDLSAAVDANADQFPPGEFHRIAQADIGRLPFAPQSFDVVLCLGVIQHTPDSEGTIRELYNQVAPKGSLIIDHYALTLSWYLKTAPLFRAFMTRMEPRAALEFTESLVNLLLPLHKRVKNVPGIRSIVHRLSPVMSYYTLYPELSDELQREWALLDTHDSLTDRFKHSLNLEQIRKIFQSLGMEDIWCAQGGNGVEARGRRPEGRPHPDQAGRN
jgi:2-polyprenyl-3-methyl-5-hydroxy-6-metoxy-1,4-benzoquinol methylase